MFFTACCTLVLIVQSTIPCAFGEKMNSYKMFLHNVQFISDIQYLFRSSSVFIVTTGNYESMLENMLMLKVFKELSRKHVLSQSLDFSKLHFEVEYYRNKSVHPLFVVILRSLDDLNSFAEATTLFDTGLHTWLIAFLESQDKRLNRICHEPQTNLFNLVIRSNMIVKCYDNPMLWEWYSVDGSKLEVVTYANWWLDKGVEKLTNKSFYERRSDFKGITLKAVAVKESAPFKEWVGTMGGFFGAIIKELSTKMNFKLNSTIEDSYGNWNVEAEKWTGALGRVVARDADIGVGEFTMTAHRVNVVDFTAPLMLSAADIYIRRPNASFVHWAVYVQAFDAEIWKRLILLIVITPILLSIMWKVLIGYDISKHIIEEYLCIWGIYCQKPLPEASSLRIAYISIFVSSLVLFAVYSAYLTSYLAAFTPSVPFDTFEGLIVDGTYKLTTLKNSAHHDMFRQSDTPLFSEMNKLLKSDEELPIDIFAAVKQVCDEKVVLYANQLSIEKISLFSSCALMSLTSGRLDNVGFILVKNSPYREILNYNLKHFRGLGITDCLKQRYFKKFIYNDSKYFPVTFSEIWPVLGILGIGLAFAILILICEYFIFRHFQLSRTKSSQSSRAKSAKPVNNPFVADNMIFYRLFFVFVYVASGTVDGKMSDTQLTEHVNLATDIKNYYRASSVLNVYSDKVAGTPILTTMFRLSKAFSSNNVLSQSVKLSMLPESVKYYKYRILIPLYIVTLKTQTDLNQFSNFAKKFSMSMNLWLVFIYKSADLLSYCSHPKENSFNLDFDTKMLVKCEGDSVIKEWYALQNKIKVNEIAVWSPSNGFVKTDHRSLWQRRNKLDGIKLRYATVKESVFMVSENNRSSLYGLFGNTLTELSNILNFSSELVSMEEIYGHYYPQYNNWSGVVGRLVARDVDIGVAEFGRSTHRLEVVDFTVPLLLTRMNLYIKRPYRAAIIWSTYTQGFDTRIWTSNLFLVIISSLIIAIMKSQIRDQKLLSLFAENCFYIWGIQCQQGLPVFPSTAGLKIAFFSLFISSTVIYIGYSATLTSYLTVFTPSLPFYSEQEFLSDESYNLTVVRGSVYHDAFQRINVNSIAKQMKRRMKRSEDLPANMMAAFHQVCNENVVLLTNEISVNKVNMILPCQMLSIPTGRLDSVAFALAKRSVYRGIINFYLERFRCYGILKVLNSRYLRKMNPSKTKYSPVSFWSTVPIMTLFFFGICLAFIILICEFIVHFIKTKK